MHNATLIPTIIVTSALLLIGCQTIPAISDTSQTPNITTPEEPIQTPSTATPERVEAMPTFLPENSVILIAEQVQDWWWYSIGFREAGEAWTPQLAHVTTLEAGLDKFLRNSEDAHFRDSPPIWERLSNYKKQYFGIIDGDRRIIYANFFCDDFGIDWQQELVSVEDGGDCFFGLKFDPETEMFFDLFVNGEA